MSYVKRQELFKNFNPLLKKYKYDGEIPPSYIPAQKRQMISTYMGRSSFNPGYYGKLISLTFSANLLLKFYFEIKTEAAKDVEMGNKTSKQSAELKNQLKSDYNKSLSERIKDGLAVKKFQNQKRIDFGRIDGNERRQR